MAVPNNPCQWWTLRPAPGSTAFLLQSGRYTERCVQSPAGPGQFVSMAPCSPALTSQRRNFVPVGDEMYITQANDANRVLAATTHQGPIELRFKTGADRQLWTLEPPV